MEAVILLSAGGALVKNRDGNLGHEQRHVNNYIAAIQAYVDGRNSSSMNGAFGNAGSCGGCISIDAENAEVQIRDYIDVIRGLNGRHAFPELTSGNTNYELLPDTAEPDPAGGNDDIPQWANQALQDADQAATAMNELILMFEADRNGPKPEDALPMVGF